MAHGVCPVWIGYLMLNPFRRLLEDPERIFAPFVSAGMTVLEPGCAMGYFTLPLARLVGREGRVIAIDLQERMLARLRSRARRAGLADRIETRRCDDDGLGITDLAGRVDFAAVMHMAHEVPDRRRLFAELHAALKPGARLLFVEPSAHVSREDFDATLAAARAAGFASAPLEITLRGLPAVLVKPAEVGKLRV